MSLPDRPFFVAGGTMPGGAQSYLLRQADRDLYEALSRGEFCYVLTARQMGKSSLMVHTAMRLREEGVTVVVLDLTAQGQNLTAAQWYDGLLGSIGQQLGLEDELDRFWMEHQRLGLLQRWMRAIRQVLLPHCPGRVAIFIDEIDVVRSLPFPTDEFFAGIRECYNRRPEDLELHRLTFCLLGVASPTDLIRDPRLTPFNIGRRIELTDFTAVEAAPLASGLLNHRGTEAQRGDAGEQGSRGTEGQKGGPAERVLQRVLYWTGGHPYLTQRLCQAVVDCAGTGGAGGGSAECGLSCRSGSNPHSAIRNPQSLVDRLCTELFLTPRARVQDDNLEFVSARLLAGGADRAAVLTCYERVLRGAPVRDDPGDPVASALQLAGVVRARRGRLTVRNRIYASIFDRAWVTANMPGAELRRQQAAYRLGLWRASLAALALAGLVAGLAGVSLRARRAAELAAEARRRQADMQVNSGAALMEAGDLPGALVWFAQSLQLDEGDARRERVDRLRLAAVLRQCPRLTAICLHHGSVGWAEFSPDGRRVVTASVDGTAQVWDAATGQPAAPPLRHPLPVSQARFSPGGQTVVTASSPARPGQPGEARLWDAASGRPLGSPMRHADRVQSIAFSPDGRLVVTASRDGTARLWDAATGQPAGPPLRHQGELRSAVFSPDGRRVLTTCGSGSGSTTAGYSQVWEVATGRPVGLPLLHRDRGVAAAFSPDGRRVVTASLDRTARVWDAATGRPVTPPLWHNAWVDDAAFSPDGRRVVTASTDGTARIWDAASGEPLTRSLPHGSFVHQARFSPDGHSVVTAGRSGAAQIWETTSDQAATCFLHQGDTVLCAAFSPDGHALVTASRDGSARIWQLPAWEGDLLLDHGSPVTQAAFSPNGRFVLTAGQDGLARIWDAATGARSGPGFSHGSPLADAAFSPDGRRVATAGADGCVRVWDLWTHRLVFPPLPHPRPVTRVAFSPDGRRLAAAGNQFVALWDAAAGQRVGAPRSHPGAVTRVVFSPSGRYLAAAGGETAQLWETATFAPAGPPLRHDGPVRSLSFASDSRLATAGWDRTARLWEVPSGRPAGPALQFRGGVDVVLFAPGGRELLTGSSGADDFDRGQAQLWDPDALRPLGSPMVHRSRVSGASISPDGTLALTATSLGLVQVWDSLSAEPVTPPLRHRSVLPQVAFAPASLRYLTRGSSERVRVINLLPDRRSPGELLLLSQLLAAQRSSFGDLQPLPAADAYRLWQDLQARRRPEPAPGPQ
jgi:WD40 repeat protein